MRSTPVTMARGVARLPSMWKLVAMLAIALATACGSNSSSESPNCGLFSVGPGAPCEPVGSWCHVDLEPSSYKCYCHEDGWYCPPAND
jgi:hypothetical protein